MFRRISAVCLAAFMALAASGCNQNGDGSGSSGNGPGSSADVNFPVVVMNEDIPAAPQTIISLSPGTTEMLFAMGYGGRVAGVGDYDDFPGGEVTKHHRCGTVLSPNKNAIEDLEPDLVVTAAPLIESDLIWFQQKGIPVVVLPRAESMAGLEANYLALATAVQGKTDGAAAGASYWAGLMSKLDEAKALSDGQEQVTAILLREMSYSMATGDTFEQQLFDRIGLINDAQRFYDWLYDEKEVKILEPQVIFANQSIPLDSIRNSTVYKPVAAVKNNKLMSVDFAVFERQSPRMFDTLLAMAEYAYQS